MLGFIFGIAAGIIAIVSGFFIGFSLGHKLRKSSDTCELSDFLYD